MRLKDDDDQADQEISELSRDEWASFMAAQLELMDSDTRLAFLKVIRWLAERPKDSEPLGQERIGQLIEEVRLENIRRRLGGKVGEILAFKAPSPDIP